MWSTLLGVVVPLLTVVLDALTNSFAPYIAAHPKVAMWVGVLTTIAGVIARSPLARYNKKEE